MMYILLSILSSTLIFILFKFINKFNARTFHVIVLNYLIAAVSGFILSDIPLNITEVLNSGWFYISALTGVLFILMFYVISLSTVKAGISVTTVASKMSVIIPVLFSVIYYNEILTDVKITGITLAIVALVLTLWKKNTGNEIKPVIILPVLLFIGLGIGDSLVKYAQASLLQPDLFPRFTSAVFMFSFISGTVALVFCKSRVKGFLRYDTYIFGLMLGLVNFGSIYFLINALNDNSLESSAVFGINNIGIVLFSVLAGFLVFREKILPLNWLGISLSFVSIWFLTGLYGI